MTPALLAPAALASLAAILIPLAIHLARRTEHRLLDFPALRWLHQTPRPRHRPRFDEWPLLLLRCLLILLLALLLARPVLWNADAPHPVLAAVPGARVDGARGVWLAPGFPSLDTVPPPRQPVASLLRQLDAELPKGASLTVLVPPVIDGMDAMLPALSRPVTWRIVAGAEPPPPPPAAAPRLVVQGAGVGTNVLHAVAAAWGGRANAPRVIAAVAPGALPSAVRDHVAAGGVALIGPRTAVAATWVDADGAIPAQEAHLGRGRLVRLTRPLDPIAMPMVLDPDFSMHLRTLLQPLPAPSRAPAADLIPRTDGPTPDRPQRDLTPHLLWTTALIWLTERLLATRSRRAPSP